MASSPLGAKLYLDVAPIHWILPVFTHLCACLKKRERKKLRKKKNERKKERKEQNE